MDLLPQMVRRRSLRSGVQKTELLTEEDETESEAQMVDILSPITRRSRLKNRNKKTNQQEELVDRNLKLLDGISDLDGVSEEERNQIVQALLNSRKELSFYHDQHEEKKNEGTSFLLESSHSTDDVPTEKQFVNNSKDKIWSDDELAVDETQAPDSFPSTDKEEVFCHKMSRKEEAMNCEEEDEEEDGYNCSTQVDSTPKLSEKSISEQVEVMDDEATQPLESMEGEKPEIESISSPGSEEKGCSVRSWTLDRIESEADKVEPLHRHYRIINGKVKRNPEFPLKMPDKLEYAKAILQMFEIYNRKLREAQTKCGNSLDWGETVKVGQHHTKTIDVKRRGQAIMTMSDSEESAENFGMDTNQTHSVMIEETQGFKTSDKKAPASTRKNISKFRINSPDIFEENTFDLVEDGFFITNTGESQLLRMETQKLTDVVELKQKQLVPDIHEADQNIVAKKSDMDISEARKINNNGRRRKREMGDAEDLDDFESKIRVTRRQIYARPAVKEIQNFEIRQSEKMDWKKGMPKTGFGKSKAMEACNGLSTPDDKKDTKMCIDHENLQVENLENKNSVKATIENFLEEMDNLSASKVIRKKGTLFPDESTNSQNDTMKFNYGDKKESGLLVEDTQNLDVSEPYMENGTLDEEGIDTTVVQESQPLNKDEMFANLQDKTKAKHHQTFKRIKQTGTELMCKMKTFFTAVQEKEEVHQGKQEGSQSPVYKKRKLLSQNTCMMEAVSVEKPGVQRLTNRPASHESNSTDPCSQGSSTMLNPVGELYSTQISIIKEKKARNLLTLNQKDTFAKSCTVFELSDSEEEDVVKQIGQGKFPQRERSQRGVPMPIKSKGRGHSQGKKSHFQRNKVLQEFIAYAEDGTVTNAKNTGFDRMVTFTSNPSTETLISNKKEKGNKDKIKREQHYNRNQGQLQEKKTINTGVEIFTNEESMDRRPDLSQTDHLPQNSWPQYSEEHSGNLKPGKSKLKLVDCSEKKVLGENCKESDALSNVKVSRDPSHVTASMEFVGTEEKLEGDQRNTNGFESKVDVKTLQVGTLTSVEKVLSVECTTGQNKDLIQAGTSTNWQGRRGYINRKVVDSGRKTPSDVLEKSTEECKKQVNKELITCPICGKDFLASQIEAHAATCMDENPDEGQQQHKRSEARGGDHTPELEKEASSLMEICYICDGHFFKGQKYLDHLEGCLEQAKRHQQEVEMKGFKTIYQSVVDKDATSRTTRSRARGHVGAGDKGLLDGLSEAWHKHEGYNNTAGRSDVKSDETCSSEDESDQNGSSHLTPPDWIKDLSSSPIRTFIPISQQQESEYFRNQFAYRLDRVEKAMTKRKRRVCRKKRTSRKRQRTAKLGKIPNKCI